MAKKEEVHSQWNGNEGMKKEQDLEMPISIFRSTSWIHPQLWDHARKAREVQRMSVLRRSEILLAVRITHLLATMKDLSEVGASASLMMYVRVIPYQGPWYINAASKLGHGTKNAGTRCLCKKSCG